MGTDAIRDVRIEWKAGADVVDAAEAMVNLAAFLGREVHATFNDVELCAKSYHDKARIVDAYWKAMMERREG